MTDIIIYFINFFTGAVGFLFPESLFMADVFTNFNYYLETFIEFLATVNFLVPLPDIFRIFSLMVSLTVIKFTLFVSNWLIQIVCELLP